MLLRTAGFIGMPGGTPPLVVASGRSKFPPTLISKPFGMTLNTQLYTCTLSAQITHGNSDVNPTIVCYYMLLQ